MRLVEPRLRVEAMELRDLETNTSKGTNPWMLKWRAGVMEENLDTIMLEDLIRWWPSLLKEPEEEPVVENLSPGPLEELLDNLLLDLFLLQPFWPRYWGSQFLK